MQSLGDRIREYRTSLRMTQADFANRLGITGASVSAYENGTRLPSYEVLVRIADILGVTTDELLGRRKADKVVIEVTHLTPIAPKRRPGHSPGRRYPVYQASRLVRNGTFRLLPRAQSSSFSPSPEDSPSLASIRSSTATSVVMSMASSWKS